MHNPSVLSTVDQLAGNALARKMLHKYIPAVMV